MGSRARRIVEAVPIDLIALVAIALAVIATHASVLQRGMPFNDPAWYFHFGQRALDGDVPYRDYVFQVGPLPIYVDAGFQSLFGERYLSSLYAGMFVKIVRVWIVWAIARRLAGARAAALFAAFCVLDVTFGWIHHWSTPYSQLFLTASGLCFVCAARAEGRRAYVMLALAGLFAGLVVSARQSTAILIALLLFGSSLILLARREYFTARRVLALWGGYAAAFAIVFGALALLGASGPAVQQMFLDAPQKKSVSVLHSTLDAISGGALVLHGFSWWGGFLLLIGLPAVLVGVMLSWSARGRAVSSVTFALLAVPVLVVVGMLSRHAALATIHDLPRTFLTATTALAVLLPARMRSWLGVEPIVALGLGGLALASDWANEMSFPGRGWGDNVSTIVGAVLLLLASGKLAGRLKLVLCAGFAVIGLVHFTVCKLRDVHPFTKDTAVESKLADNKWSSRNPVLRGLRVTEARKEILHWLEQQVPPGSTCFMYGNLIAVYDLLRCDNPTRVDTTIADFLSIDDAHEVIATLRAAPPAFLIAQEFSFANPSLEVELEGHTSHYSPVNPEAARVLHGGLRALLPQYESVGYINHVIGPALEKQIEWAWDSVSGTRLYRRKR